MELDPAVLGEAQGSRAPRSVSAHREDADRRQAFLQLQAHSGAGKLAACGAPGVVQESKNRLRVERSVEQRRKPCLCLLDLGPGRVQQVVRQAVNARCDARRALAAVGEEKHRSYVSHEQAEAVVVRGALFHESHVLLRACPPGEEIGDQRPARGRARLPVRGIPVVRQRSESPVQGDAEPGASGFQIAPGEDIRMVVPESGLRSRTPEILVAVGRDDLSVARMRTPGERDQAHGD